MKRFKSREEELKYIKFLQLEAKCDEYNLEEMKKHQDNYATKKHANHLKAVEKRWEKEMEAHKKIFMKLRGRAESKEEYRKRYHDVLGDSVPHIKDVAFE